MRKLLLAFAVAATLASAVAAEAQNYPAPKEGDWVARDFRFHTGEVVPELRVHYTTVGAPSGEPIVILHGTSGSGTGMLTPSFAGELFGPGSPWTRASISSSFRIPSATVKLPSPQTVCALSFPVTITMTWSWLNIAL